MKKKNYFSQMILSLAMTSFLLTGCAGDGASGSTAFNSDSTYSAKASYDAGAGAYREMSEAGDYDSYEDVEAEESVADGSEGQTTIGENADTQLDTSATIDRSKIVYSGSMTIETLNFEDTVSKLYDLIEKKGGIIQSENSYEYTPNYSSDRKAHSIDITIRIPANDFRSFMQGTQDIGRVVSSNTNADNITRQYYDVAARRSSLQTELTRLNELVEDADTTEDLINIMDRIADVQGDLDSLEAQLRTMDTDVAYSTITISVMEVIEYSATPESFGERIADAFSGSWHNFVAFVQGALIFLIYLLPAIIAFVIVVLIVLAIVLLYQKKHPRKPRAAKRSRLSKEKITSANVSDNSNDSPSTNAGNNSKDNASVNVSDNSKDNTSANASDNSNDSQDTNAEDNSKSNE